MSAEPNLLQKVDALLNKHRNPNGVEPTEDIPILTEVIEPQEPSPTVTLTASGLTTSLSTEKIPALSDAEVEALSRDIFRHVMSKLSRQISYDLRLQVVERLSSIIDNAVAAAIEDFRQELANSVGDGIAEALLDRAERSNKSELSTECD